MADYTEQAEEALTAVSNVLEAIAGQAGSSEAMDRVALLSAEIGVQVAATYANLATAEQMRRVADRLDSWTHTPDLPPEWYGQDSAEAKASGPELRIRRW